MRFFLLGVLLLHTSALIAAPAQKVSPAPQVQKPSTPSSSSTDQNKVGDTPSNKDQPKSLISYSCDCTALIACQSAACLAGPDCLKESGRGEAVQNCFTLGMAHCCNQGDILGSSDCSAQNNAYNTYCNSANLCSINGSCDIQAHARPSK
jgi:hypothetical protein